MPSPLSFDSTKLIRNTLMGKNLGQYTVPGVFTPTANNLNYETVLTFSDVKDSTNNPNTKYPKDYYVINEFGPDGGYSNTMVLINTLNSGPNKGLYLESFVPSKYTPFSILSENNPTGTDGSLSQDSGIAQFGAKQLKMLFEDRINIEIYQSTVGKVNLSSLQDPFQASLVATGKQPLIYRNWKITVPENPIVAAVDFATRISGAYWPVSFIPGDYFQENENNGLPTSQTSTTLQSANQLTGGLLGPVLNLSRNPSQIFLANTGNGQKSALFANLYYNKYRPNYDGSFGGFLGAIEGLVNSISSIINPNGTVTSNYYIGTPNSEPGQITAPPNQIPVNSSGQQVSSPVYGPDEIGKLFEGNINQLKFGLGVTTNAEKLSPDGSFVWTSPKYKDNAGYHPTVGGGVGSRDDEFNLINSTYQSNLSTNIELKPGSILYNTQKLIDSADSVTGPNRLKHVGNAINQVSKVFNDGYKEMTKGSKVVSYTDNTTGSQAGVEYCRVFAKDTPYYTYADLQKTDGITKSGRLFEYSVLDNTYNLNIAPLKGQDSTNIVPGDKNGVGGYAKKYMFSIENLAWRTSGRDGFKYDDLPLCERGPNGGRVMWFPPYDIKFSDSSNANWNPTSFIGRPEPIYTYKDTSRSGNLSWKIVVDHPSVLNLIVNNQLKDGNSERVNSIIDAFFAGCAKFDLYTLASKFNKIPVSELQQIQDAINNPRLTPEELSNLKKAIPADNTVPDTKSATQGGNQNTTVDNNPAIDAFKTDFKQGFGFYFENDVPKSTGVNFNEFYTSYISDGNKTKYEQTSSNTFADGNVNRNTNEFFKTIEGNYKKFNEGESSFIERAYKLLKENIAKDISVEMIGSASATASVPYNKSLSERRLSSVKKYFEDSKLGEFMKDNARFKITLSKGEGEKSIVPVSEEGVTGGEIICTTDIKDKNNRITPNSQIYALQAMACRRVRVLNITANPVVVEPAKPEVNTGGGENPTNPPREITFEPIKPKPKPNVSQDLKKGLSKKVLRSLLSECDYFDMIKENNPLVYTSIKEKIKYFSPAFHAMTPEGLNSRLTFLNQCVRPGETIPIIGPDGKPRYNDSLNTSFGTPPVLILRIGDFYHTKIIPNSISFSYEPLIFDMNPEGIGVQPMIVEVQLAFNIIGGMGLKEPVDQLQNALSFNFYANTEIYDERATYTDTSFEALDKKVFDSILANSGGVPNQTVNNQQQTNGGEPIGQIKKEALGTQNGEIVYQQVMDKLLDVSKSYFENTINQLEKIQTQYNFGVVQLVNDNKSRKYVDGTVGQFTDMFEAIYGKPSITKTTDLFKDVIDSINTTSNESGPNPIIAFIIKKGFPATDQNIITLKQNMVQYVTDSQSSFDLGLTTIIQEIVTQQMDLLTYIRKINLVYEKTDGFLRDGNTPVVYNLSGSTKAGDTVTPGVSNTYDEFTKDIDSFSTGLTSYLLLLQNGYNDKNDGVIINPSPFDLNNPLTPLDVTKFQTNVMSLSFYMVMSRILTDENKKLEFIKTLLSPNISNNKKLVKYLNKICDNLADDYSKQLKTEMKQFEKMKNSDKFKKYINSITTIMYNKSKPRKFEYSTVPGPNQTTQETKIKQIYGNVNYGSDDKSFNGIIKMN